MLLSINFTDISFIIALAGVVIFLILVESIYQIHKSIDKQTAVQIAQNELLQQLINQNQANATNVPAPSTSHTDNSKIDHP